MPPEPTCRPATIEKTPHVLIVISCDKTVAPFHNHHNAKTGFDNLFAGYNSTALRDPRQQKQVRCKRFLWEGQSLFHPQIRLARLARHPTVVRHPALGVEYNAFYKLVGVVLYAHD